MAWGGEIWRQVIGERGIHSTPIDVCVCLCCFKCTKTSEKIEQTFTIKTVVVSSKTSKEVEKNNSFFLPLRLSNNKSPNYHSNKTLDSLSWCFVFSSSLFLHLLPGIPFPNTMNKNGFGDQNTITIVWKPRHKKNNRQF